MLDLHLWWLDLATLCHAKRKIQGIRLLSNLVLSSATATKPPQQVPHSNYKAECILWLRGINKNPRMWTTANGHTEYSRTLLIRNLARMRHNYKFVSFMCPTTNKERHHSICYLNMHREGSPPRKRCDKDRQYQAAYWNSGRGEHGSRADDVTIRRAFPHASVYMFVQQSTVWQPVVLWKTVPAPMWWLSTSLVNYAQHVAY